MKIETKVGLLFLVSIVLVVAFAYVLGAFNPFSNSNDIYLMYNFAGGIEEGSKVRVMGITVGRVKSIEFRPDMKTKEGEEVKLRIRVGINKKAWQTVRSDSKFYINLAGVIGEKFIEVSPGTLQAPALEPGAHIRGEDPPRIDQLISQSYGLAGKVLEIVEENESSLIETVETVNNLVSNLNKTLKLIDKATADKDTKEFIRNVTQIAGDLAFLTGKIRTEEGKKTLALLHKLLWRLEDLDAKNIRKFLQDEGIRAKIF